MSTYKDNRKEATEVLLEDSRVAAFFPALARNGFKWSGKPQQLYQMISKAAMHTLGPRWPKTISMFGSEFRRIAPQLRLHGISIGFERNVGGGVITVKVEDPTAGQPSTNTQTS
jgi:hypothetical protein